MGFGTRNDTGPKPTLHTHLNRLVGRNDAQFRFPDCKADAKTQIQRLNSSKTKFLGFEIPKWIPTFGTAWDQNLPFILT